MQNLIQLLLLSCLSFLGNDKSATNEDTDLNRTFIFEVKVRNNDGSFEKGVNCLQIFFQENGQEQDGDASWTDENGKVSIRLFHKSKKVKRKGKLIIKTPKGEEVRTISCPPEIPYNVERDAYIVLLNEQSEVKILSQGDLCTDIALVHQQIEKTNKLKRERKRITSELKEKDVVIKKLQNELNNVARNAIHDLEDLTTKLSAALDDKVFLEGERDGLKKMLLATNQQIQRHQVVINKQQDSIDVLLEITAEQKKMVDDLNKEIDLKNNSINHLVNFLIPSNLKHFQMIPYKRFDKKATNLRYWEAVNFKIPDKQGKIIPKNEYLYFLIKVQADRDELVIQNQNQEILLKYDPNKQFDLNTKEISKIFSNNPQKIDLEVMLLYYNKYTDLGNNYKVIASNQYEVSGQNNKLKWRKDRSLVSSRRDLIRKDWGSLESFVNTL